MVDVVSLIALGVGYSVYVSASKEKATVQFLGKGIGVLIMIASVLFMLTNSMMCMFKKGCPFSTKSSCPMMVGQK